MFRNKTKPLGEVLSQLQTEQNAEKTLDILFTRDIAIKDPAERYLALLDLRALLKKNEDSARSKAVAKKSNACFFTSLAATAPLPLLAAWIIAEPISGLSSLFYTMLATTTAPTAGKILEATTKIGDGAFNEVRRITGQNEKTLLRIAAALKDLEENHTAALFASPRRDALEKANPDFSASLLRAFTKAAQKNTPENPRPPAPETKFDL